MIAIHILEDSDIIQPTDFMRPLQLEFSSGGHGDNIFTEATYTGHPINNLQWVRVDCVLGEYWYGKTVADYKTRMRDFTPYEFVRGPIPRAHQLVHVKPIPRTRR